MSETTDVRTHKAIALRVDDELFNHGRLDVADELFAADFVYHDGTGSPAHRGPDGVKQFVTMFRTAFPDLRLTVDDQIGEADKVAYRWTARGTHRGELMGIAPTGRSITIGGIAIARFADGRIVEIREHYDALGLLQQLGAYAR